MSEHLSLQESFQWPIHSSRIDIKEGGHFHKNPSLVYNKKKLREVFLFMSKQLMYVKTHDIDHTGNLANKMQPLFYLVEFK